MVLALYGSVVRICRAGASVTWLSNGHSMGVIVNGSNGGLNRWLIGSVARFSEIS